MSSTQSLFRFRLPGSVDVVQGCGQALHGMHDGAFIVAPFEDAAQGTISIVADSRLDWPDLDKLELPETAMLPDLTIGEYAAKVDRAKSTLACHNEKVVLSRRKFVSGRLDIEATWQALLDTCPRAFCNMFYSPSTGLWMGASPELLLKVDANRAHTMALAGTRPACSGGDWDRKNVCEQQIVTDYIVNVFNTLGLNPTVSEPYTRPAGPVEHICTDIASPLPHGLSMEQLLLSLSPTPALAGYPKTKAMQTIADIEGCKRGPYGGYVGFRHDDAQADFYVNLRCMQVFANGVVLYAGGGITLDSVGADEYHETCRKASTLQSILKFVG